GRFRNHASHQGRTKRHDCAAQALIGPEKPVLSQGPEGRSWESRRSSTQNLSEWMHVIVRDLADEAEKLVSEDRAFIEQAYNLEDAGHLDRGLFSRAHDDTSELATV